MTTQPTLFDIGANTATAQPDLWADDGDWLDVDRCTVCGHQRTRTPSGYVTCWNNCTGLQPIHMSKSFDIFDDEHLTTTTPAE